MLIEEEILALLVVEVHVGCPALLIESVIVKYYLKSETVGMRVQWSWLCLGKFC